MRTQTGDIAINYEIGGDGPDLVLTHGMGGRLQDWDATAAALEARYRVLRWDVRGFGRSDKPHGPVTPAVWARDLAGLLDALAIPRAVVLGFSMGGVVAQRFALDYPDRTRALILMNTSSEVGPKAAQRWNLIAERLESDGMAAIVGKRPALQFSEDFQQTHEAALDAYDAQRLKNDPLAYAAGGRAVSDYNYTAELDGLSCPTLILQGAQDRITPPGGSVIMSRRIPGARLEILEGCGHMMPVERLDSMVDLLRDFLAQFD